MRKRSLGIWYSLFSYMLNGLSFIWNPSLRDTIHVWGGQHFSERSLLCLVLDSLSHAQPGTKSFLSAHCDSCHQNKKRSLQSPCHPKQTYAGVPALWLRSRQPIRATGLVFLSLQAAHESSSSWLGAVCLFPCTMSQAQPLRCCLGPSSPLERGHMHQEWARTMLKRKGSNSWPGLCRSRCPRTYSYTPHAASRGKMAASCWAAAGYLHCLMSVISPGHTLCVRVERDQRSRFPVKDAGGTYSHVCLTGFTDRGFANRVCLKLQLRPPLCSCEKSIWGCSWTCLLGTTRRCHHSLALQERSPSGHVCSTNPYPGKWRPKQGWLVVQVVWPTVQSVIEMGFTWHGKSSQFLSSRCTKRKCESTLMPLCRSVLLHHPELTPKSYVKPGYCMMVSWLQQSHSFLLSHHGTGAEVWCSGMLGSCAARESFGTLLQGRKVRQQNSCLWNQEFRHTAWRRPVQSACAQSGVTGED